MGGMAAANLLLGCGQFFHLSPIDRLDQCIPGGKVAIQSSRSNAGLFGDVVEAGIRPERVNASFATSRIRSRFRCASVRGFVEQFVGFFVGMGYKKVATGDSLRLSYLLIRRHSPF